MNKIVRHIKLSKLIGEPLTGEYKLIDDFFIDLFDGLESYRDINYPTTVYYIKRVNGLRVFYMKKKFSSAFFLCSFDNFWSKVPYIHDDYSQKQSLIKGMIELNLGYDIGIPVRSYKEPTLPYYVGGC